MKLDKIYKICKKAASITLWNKKYMVDDEEQVAMQYIVSTFAAYPLENLPLFNDRTIYGLLGIDAEQAPICHVSDMPEWFEKAINDCYNNLEVPLDRVTDIFGYTLLVTHHQSSDDGFPERCFFVNPTYLAPITDDDVDLYFREIEDRKCIIARSGMITKAVILPKVFSTSDKLLEKIEWLRKANDALIVMQQDLSSENEGSEIKNEFSI